MFGIVVPSFLKDIIPERVSIKSIEHQKHKHQIMDCEKRFVVSFYVKE